MDRTGEGGKETQMDRWLWLCPIIGVVAAGVLFWAYGFGWLSALGFAFLVACPALVVWTLREAHSAFAARDRLASGSHTSRHHDA